jgi:hypothetical protein
VSFVAGATGKGDERKRGKAGEDQIFVDGFHVLN